MTKEEADHKQCLEGLTYSTEGTMAIAKWFVDNGIDVFIKGIKKAPTRAQWKKYADKGDTFICKEGIWNKIETKRLSIDFTNKRDCCCKDKLIICAKHSYDNAKRKAHAYVITNDKMTHVAIVRNSSASEWYTDVKKDSRYVGYCQEFYLCPIDLVEFRRMYEA